MLDRKQITPNNRKNNRLSDFVKGQVINITNPKSTERQTVFSYLRSGKPVSQGASGGGRIVNKQ